MSKLTVTFAASDYEHTRDLTRGDIQAEGIDLRYLKLEIEETFFRFIKFREWDVSEMSFGKYIALKSQNDDSITGIPVFPSRVFRQSSLFVLPGSGIKDASDLRGKRIGIPEWAQTASIYTRGWLVHQVGIPLQQIGTMLVQELQGGRLIIDGGKMHAGPFEDARVVRVRARTNVKAFTHGIDLSVLAGAP